MPVEEPEDAQLVLGAKYQQWEPAEGEFYLTPLAPGYPLLRRVPQKGWTAEGGLCYEAPEMALMCWALVQNDYHKRVALPAADRKILIALMGARLKGDASSKDSVVNYLGRLIARKVKQHRASNLLARIRHG